MISPASQDGLPGNEILPVADSVTNRYVVLALRLVKEVVHGEPRDAEPFQHTSVAFTVRARVALAPPVNVQITGQNYVLIVMTNHCVDFGRNEALENCKLRVSGSLIGGVAGVVVIRSLQVRVEHMQYDVLVTGGRVVALRIGRRRSSVVRDTRSDTLSCNGSAPLVHAHLCIERTLRSKEVSVDARSVGNLVELENRPSTENEEAAVNQLKRAEERRIWGRNMVKVACR
mmetsp:Transcript_14433/g.56752  ORF Transcript_14433/g.56752 Transcript_14433/m.56752 type:complete len:230 (+) Transcript_14433:271-960(+)